MPRIIYDHTHPDLMRHLNERGFLNYSYCKENIPGMSNIARNTFHKTMTRFGKRRGMNILKKKMMQESPSGLRSQTAYYCLGYPPQPFPTQTPLQADSIFAVTIPVYAHTRTLIRSLMDAYDMQDPDEITNHLIEIHKFFQEGL
jgi:hypothetical protein